MATITQTIPTYVLGISEQPDDKKLPGQVRKAVNVVPDVTEGLMKRPGSKFVNTLSGVQTNGCWFSYYRDENEGSYIGQVARNGVVRVWRCSDGAAMTINNSNSPNTYLAHSADGDVQALTINDSTFLVNRTKTVNMTSAVAASKPDTHSVYVELKQVVPRRQYALNIFSNTTTVAEKSAVTVTVDMPFNDNISGEDNAKYSGSKVQVDSATGIAVRVTITGQPFVEGYDNSPPNARYDSMYTARVDLLHGGSYSGTLPSFTVNVEGINHTVTVTKEVSASYKGNLNRVRPVPVDLEAEAGTSVASLLSSIKEQITGVTATVIGSGLYLTHTSAFNVEALESDLFNIVTDNVNDVTSLPKQCKNGYIVKVTNSAQLVEDDYYLKFEGDNNQDGSGYWSECAGPGVTTTIDPATMPYILQRTNASTMTLGQYSWSQREVGDNLTNKLPTFITKKINKVLFHRNRLVMLSGSNIILSQPGDLGNFWNKTALTFSGVDRIDISCSSSSPNQLVDGIEMNTGLVLFSGNAQYLFSTDSDALNPETAKVYSLATYNYNVDVAPISLGTSIAFIDNAGKYSRFFEMVNIGREGEPDVIENSKVVSRLLGTGLNLIANSRENSFILMSSSGSQDVIGYRYYNQGDKRVQTAWFSWRLRRPIKYHYIIDDDYFVIHDDSTLTRMSLKTATSTPTILDNEDEFDIHLDHFTTVATGSMTYNTTTRKTTFDLPAAFNTSGSVAAIVTNNSDDKGRYQIVEGMEQSFESLVGEYSEIDVNDSINAEFIDLNTADLEGSTVYDLESGTTHLNSLAGSSTEYDSGGQTVSLTGDWTNNPITIGYLFEMSVELPTIYATKTQSNRVVADTSSSLIIQRLKFNFGNIGEFWTTLKRNGKPDYVDKHESSMLNSYSSNTAPYESESLRTVPVYERNTNVNVILKSTHPSPATLQSMAWEGEYNSRFYKRV
jgi:Rieske Fe-S protein